MSCSPAADGRSPDHRKRRCRLAPTAARTAQFPDSSFGAVASVCRCGPITAPWRACFHTAILVDPASSICLSQSLSHACISPHGWKSETANKGMGSVICAIMVAKLKLKVFDGYFGAGKGVRPSVPLSAAAYLQLVVPGLSPTLQSVQGTWVQDPALVDIYISPQWWNHGGRVWLSRRLLTRGDPQAPRHGKGYFIRGQMGAPPVRVESRRQADLVVVALRVDGHLVGCPRPQSRSHAGTVWVVSGGLWCSPLVGDPARDRLHAHAHLLGQGRDVGAYRDPLIGFPIVRLWIDRGPNLLMLGGQPLAFPHTERPPGEAIDQYR